MNIEDSVMSAALRSRIRRLKATGKNEYSCVMEFDPDFTGFAGHFEGNPIVPGVCLIEAARVIAEAATATQLRTTQIAQCRFRRPVCAGENADATLKITDSETPGVRNIRADIRVGGATAAQMRLEVQTR